MGAKSSKEEKGKASEIEKLAPSDNVPGIDDVEAGIFQKTEEEEEKISINVIGNRAESVKSKEMIIDIPGTVETGESEEKAASRITSGSEISIHGLNNDLDIIHSALSESAFNDTEFSYVSDSSEASTGPQFDVMDYLKSRGIDVSHPNIRDLVESQNYQEFIQLKKLMLTPKELFERDNGPIQGGDSVRVIRKGEATEEELKTLTPLFSEIVASGTPRSSDSLTDLSDDENGWPKYDMNALMEKYEKTPNLTKNPLVPTLADYVRDKASCGQQVYNHYEFVHVYSYVDKPTHLECHGPDGTRTQDFWTQCHNDRISLISMFGNFHEERGVNCARYIPVDNREELICGKVMIRRLTDPEYSFEHCKIQKFAARHISVPEDHGWYPVWHCQRAFQDDPSKDYTQQNAEFHELRMRLLKEMPSNEWLQHGPMLSSALLNPIIERNWYLIHKEGSKVPEFLEQPIEAQRMRHPFYQEYRDYVHPDHEYDHVITVSSSASSISS